MNLIGRLCSILLLAVFCLPSGLRAGASSCFTIEVVDEQTGRGVPLVELATVDQVRCYTDSAGIVAFDEPGLMGQKVFFTISSYGYEFPPDGFGIHGAALDVKAGGSAKLKIKRINIAERLYRITGQGIYRESVLAGRKPPIKQPLLNAQVVGQDSVCSTVYRDKAWFFWGDTSRLSYPLGNFNTTGATAGLPGRGGLDPGVGIDLNYLPDEHGFTKKMVPLADKGPVWIGALMNLPDDKGEMRMLAHYSRMESLAKRLEQGLIVFNDKTQVFEKLKTIDLDAPVTPGGHPFTATVDGVEYIYFPQPYPSVRAKANWKSVTDLSTYESFTCLEQGTKVDKKNPKLDRDDAGKLRFSWKKNTPPMNPRDFEELAKAGAVQRDESPFRLKNIDDGKPIILHGGSVYWNDYRKRYVMIGLEVLGASVLGEVWYAEAPAPQGPWAAAKKIVTHHRELAGDLSKRSDDQDFYNPKQHPFLDQQGGRIIYFEGTYTHSFAGNPIQTPRYDYNQIMYRLDLSDPRLKFSE